MIVYRELSSIEQALGFSAKVLYSVANTLPRHYHRVEIPKASGGTRVLTVPDEGLKRIQRAIAEKLLSYEPISRCAAAYHRGASLLKNASPHIGKEKLLKLDIRNFFDSITYAQIKESAFPADRYAEPLRILLARLCYYQDGLPQGAPSSPMLSNIVMRKTDRRIELYCSERNVRYTRYSDDLFFSGAFDEKELESFVGETLREKGFFLNRKKTLLAPAQKRQTVTGIVVNEKPNLPSDYRRKIRQEVYYCRRFGVSGHLARLSSDPSAPGASPHGSASPEVGRSAAARAAGPREAFREDSREEKQKNEGTQADSRHDAERTEAARRYLTGLLGRISYVLSICPGDSSFLRYKEEVCGYLRALSRSKPLFPDLS